MFFCLVGLFLLPLSVPLYGSPWHYLFFPCLGICDFNCVPALLLTSLSNILPTLDARVIPFFPPFPLYILRILPCCHYSGILHDTNISFFIFLYISLVSPICFYQGFVGYPVRPRCLTLFNAFIAVSTSLVVKCLGDGSLFCLACFALTVPCIVLVHFSYSSLAWYNFSKYSAMYFLTLGGVCYLLIIFCYQVVLYLVTL